MMTVIATYLLEHALPPSPFSYIRASPTLKIGPQGLPETISACRKFHHFSIIRLRMHVHTRFIFPAVRGPCPGLACPVLSCSGSGQG